MEHILYKKRNGGILIWKATIVDLISKATIKLESGKIKDKLRVYTTDITEGKNIGKKNETSVLTQAKLELESKVNKKLMEGYVKKDIPDLIQLGGEDSVISYLLDNLTEGIDKNGNIKPMLAASYFKSSKAKLKDGRIGFLDPTGRYWKDRKYYYIINPYLDIPNSHIGINFPCFGQAKLNGVRCTAVITIDEVKLFSKEGTTYNVPHIIQELYKNRLAILGNFNEDTVILDGELYSHNTPLETIVSSIRGNTDMFTPLAEYHIYDVVNESIMFKIRNQHLLNLFNIDTFNNNTYIKRVNTHIISNHSQAQKFTDAMINKGYEGGMFRNPVSVYKPNKRMTNILIKLKRVIQEEFNIVNIKSQEKDKTLGLFEFKNNEGELFEVNPTFSKEKCKELLDYKNNYIGKKVTLTFFEYTDRGIPKHVIDTIIRDYE